MGAVRRAAQLVAWLLNRGDREEKGSEAVRPCLLACEIGWMTVVPLTADTGSGPVGGGGRGRHRKSCDCV